MNQDNENPTTTDQDTTKSTNQERTVIPHGRTPARETIRRTVDGSTPPPPRIIIDVEGFANETPAEAKASADKFSAALPGIIEQAMICRDTGKPPEGTVTLDGGEWTLVSVEVRDCEPPYSGLCHWQLWAHPSEDSVWVQIPIT